MSRLTLRLPETLHQRLTSEAQEEGVSLNQYLVYLLSQRAKPLYRVTAHSAQERRQQRKQFEQLLEELGPASPEDVQLALDSREATSGASNLTPEAAQEIREKIRRMQKSPA